MAAEVTAQPGFRRVGAVAESGQFSAQRLNVVKARLKVFRRLLSICPKLDFAKAGQVHQEPPPGLRKAGGWCGVRPRLSDSRTAFVRWRSSQGSRLRMVGFADARQTDESRSLAGCELAGCVEGSGLTQR